MLQILFWLVIGVQSSGAPDKGEPMTVHVKEVHRIQDENPTKEGAWFHITAIVETKTVIYSLKCDEYISNEKHGYAVGCFHLAAGKDYPAHRFPTAMNFWQPEDNNKGYTLALYDIESEKEK